MCSYSNGACEFLRRKEPHVAAGNEHEPTQIAVSLRAQSGSLFLVIVIVLLVDLLSKGCTTILLKYTKSELKLKQDSWDYISDLSLIHI